MVVERAEPGERPERNPHAHRHDRSERDWHAHQPSHPGHGGATDPNSTNNTATDTDALALPADLAVTITDAATTLVPGAVDTYTITVTNNGANTVSSFTLIDTIPDALLNATAAAPRRAATTPAADCGAG